ncbi:MAG: hypothetical protein KJP12_07125 [Acidimicrobiia bacterium]|nr:hypothetical protein [Acidimicrobiia bacterium]MBT8214981.1 hypothetical protein [Acidimicrobiia bacterium]NND83992.1 hypothetical protein [Acidimicrobiia bacterium]NNF68843.1 hypothetical protein [Acidimicrobiia bacterium]
MTDSTADVEPAYRCEACGNKTRFDVFETVRRRRFAHFDLGGVSVTEEEEILGHSVEKIVCRWCDRSDAIEEFRPGDVP